MASFESEHHIVKDGGKYQLTIFEHGRLKKKGMYDSYADAMTALIRYQKEKEKRK